MKALTRGEPVGPETFAEIIDDLDLPRTEKARLLAVTPRDYVGHASALVDALANDER